MGFDVKQVADGIPQDVEFTYNGHVIHLTYNLAAMGPKLDKWFEENADARRLTPGWIERVVMKWDITDGGVPIPITAEAIEKYALPDSLINMIFAVIRDDSSIPNLRRAWSGGSRTA